MLLFKIQTKNTDTHTYANSWDSEDGDRNQQTNKLSSRFFYNAFLYWPLLIAISFLYWEFFQAGETKPMK